jgi:hypothetical protein
VVHQQTKTRDIRLDAFRGLFLVGMTIDHLPSVLSKWVYEALGFVTAAEGFVFLSGLVAGLLYTRVAIKEGDRAMWTRACKRAALIYSYHFAVFLLVLAALRTVAPKEFLWSNWRISIEGSLPTAILSGALLVYQPWLLDVLPMYCVFVLLTPIIIRRAQAGKSVYVLGTSFLVWALAQYRFRDFLSHSLFSGVPVHLGDFDVLGWQFLFVIGVLMGFSRYQSDERCLERFRPAIPIALALVMGLFLCKHRFISGLLPSDDWALLAGKKSLGPLRLMNFFALCFLTLFAAKHVKPGLITRVLAYLGKHSLQVFSFQILLAFGVFWTHQRGLFVDPIEEVIVVVICLNSLFACAWVAELVKRGRRESELASRPDSTADYSIR